MLLFLGFNTSARYATIIGKKYNAILIFFFFFRPRGKWKLIIFYYAEFSALKIQPARNFY